MPYKRKPKPWEQKKIEEQKAREDAFETAVNANPDLHRELRNAVRDAQEVSNEIYKKYRPLTHAQTDANSLKSWLEESGLIEEATIVAGLITMLEKAFQPISASLSVAEDAYEVAVRALKEQFPYEEGERRPDI